MLVFSASRRSLERESGLYFDAEHLVDLVRRGAWDGAKRYLRGFTGADESPCSAKILFAIRKQKYLEALDRRITAEEGQLLVNDLKAVAPFDEEVAKIVAALENFRQLQFLDAALAQNAVAMEIKKLIEADPLLQDKLEFPSFEASRLRTLVTQSLDWRHSRCKKPRQIPDASLLSDHCCDSSSNTEISGTKEKKRGARITQNVKPRKRKKSEKIKTWNFANISDSGHLQALRMPDKATTCSKVVGLLYKNNGIELLALCSNAVHKWWEWQHSNRNSNSKYTLSASPQLWQPANDAVMKNDTSDGNPEEAIACFALSKNESYVISAYGGKVSVFCMLTFKVLYTLMMPPPAATFIAIHPRGARIIACGMEDSTIQIYSAGQVTNKLRGHQKMITGLAFPEIMNVLVSSGADAQLCVWSVGNWEKIKSRYIQPPANQSGASAGDTRVQFHSGCTRLLVVHEIQLAIYDLKLECLCLWFPRDTLPAPISSAIYSCDGLLVYAGFRDGAIGVFEARSLSLCCRIAPAAYIPPSISSAVRVYPMVIAAHPAKPNQIALGMSDGAVYVLEPV